MGSTKNVSIAETEVTYKVIDSAQADTQAPAAPSADDVKTESADQAEVKKASTKPKKARPHSPKYQATRSQVDKTRLYDPFSAIELVKKLSYSKFDGTISADGVVSEIGEKITVAFPHTTGKAIKVAIADEDLIKNIEAGQFDFDVLLASPQYMPKLAKLARVLGPKGLMPNPKNGTVATEPEKKKAELESGKIIVKTEKKAPLIHVPIGKTSADTKELVENLAALTKAGGEKIKKLSLSATMSPGVRVELKR